MSDEIRACLSENLNRIRERIAVASERAHRSPGDVKLIAVTKYAQMEWVRELVELGAIDLGESRPQQLVSRAHELPDHIQWHMIGHLQRNKADIILPVACLIHSVDSLRLFDHLAKSAKSLPRRPRVLLEVNVSGEASKDGFDPKSLLAAWPQMRTCDTLVIAGLMTMAPLGDSAEVARPVFRKLRELRDQLRLDSGTAHPLNELSMGMSGDFEVGIEEGATIVRIGSSLFDGLTVDA